MDERTMGGRRFARWLGAGVVALGLGWGLVACGGGGSDAGGSGPTFSDPPAGPPATAATVSATPSDAVAVTQSALASANGLVAQKNALSGLEALLGDGITAQAASPLRPVLIATGRKHALATTTEACQVVVDAPCSGTVTADTNIPDTATSVTAGQYLDATFNAINGSLGGNIVTLGGRLRVEFLTGFNLSSSSLNGLGLRLVFTGFTGSVAGDSFGPVSQTMDLSFSAQGVPSLVTGGASFGSVAGVTITGPDTFAISSGSARVGYGSLGVGYVDVTVSGWHTSAGRPVVGSAATVTAGSVSASVSVTASSATTVTYTVTVQGVSGGSVSGTYEVTAIYPADGGAPTYSARIAV